MAHAEGRELTPDAAATVLEKWIAEDRKATPLKALQGMIWRQGYESGELKGHVYDDTPDAQIGNIVGTPLTSRCIASATSDVTDWCDVM